MEEVWSGGGGVAPLELVVLCLGAMNSHSEILSNTWWA